MAASALAESLSQEKNMVAAPLENKLHQLSYHGALSLLLNI